MLQQWCKIRCDHVEAFTDANYQRGVLSVCHQHIRLILCNQAQGKSSFHLANCLVQGFLQVVALFVVLADKLSSYLCVCFAFEVNSFFKEFALQFQVVLNQSVVDQGYAACLVLMRMGIQGRWCTVGCPSGVADAHVSSQLLAADQSFQIFYFSYMLSYSNAILVYYCDAGRVISPVLQFFQSFDNNVLWFCTSYEAYDAAHNDSSCLPETLFIVSIF